MDEGAEIGFVGEIDLGLRCGIPSLFGPGGGGGGVESKLQCFGPNPSPKPVGNR